MGYSKNYRLCLQILLQNSRILFKWHWQKRFFHFYTYIIFCIMDIWDNKITHQNNFFNLHSVQRQWHLINFNVFLVKTIRWLTTMQEKFSKRRKYSSWKAFFILCKSKAKLLFLVNTQTPTPVLPSQLADWWDIYPSIITFVLTDNEVLSSTDKW